MLQQKTEKKGQQLKKIVGNIRNEEENGNNMANGRRRGDKINGICTDF